MTSENKLPNWKARMAQEAEEDRQFQGILTQEVDVNTWCVKESFI